MSKGRKSPRQERQPEYPKAAAQFPEPVSPKRPYKFGVISMGERVKRRLERQADPVGAAEAVRTLNRLIGEKLIAAVNRAELMRNRSGVELERIRHSSDPVDRALNFLYAVSAGSGRELDALRRNPAVNRDLGLWIRKANRIIARHQHKQQRKLQEEEAARQKMKIIVRRNRS
jgi:hypothetical protein